MNDLATMKSGVPPEAAPIEIEESELRCDVALKIVSMLLQYPDAELCAARGELLEAAYGLPEGPQRDSISLFLAHWLEIGDDALEREFVADVDFNRESTFYLSFHTFGDRRDRGVAMLDLKRRYKAAGMPLANGELPDYLPVVLEFAAFAPPEHARAVLDDFRIAIDIVRESMHETGSAYAHLLEAVCAELPELTAEQRAMVEELREAGPPDELVGLEPFNNVPPEVFGGCGSEL